MKFTPFLFALFSFFAIADSHYELATAIDPDGDEVNWGPCPPIFPKTCQLAVLHGDPAKPNTDMLLKAPKGTKFVAHTHTSAERMILVSGKMEVRYQGQEKRILNKGDYAYGPANRPHDAKCLKGPCVLFIAFEKPVDAMIFEGSLD